MVGWNYRMTEMQSAIGLAEVARMDTWNMPRRKRNAQILIKALKPSRLIKYFPVDTAERRNGWYVLAFSLEVEQLKCDIKQFVAAVAAEGAPVWKVFWPQCHTERAFREHHAFGRSRFPFRSKEYTAPASADYSQVQVPNAVWHQDHTFTCFAYPTYEPHHCEQIAEALVKVIRAYAK
jgi:dTDP-4-amino-4,6-dideoxygalactose transaminase